MIILHILLYSAIILLHFLLYFPIRWCKKENGKVKVLLLQDPHRASLFERSKDGFRVVQKSVIFYRISENDTNLEFMCESRYGLVCGAQGINLTLSVPTIVKSTGGSFLIRRIPCHCDINSFYLIILPQYSATYTTPHITCTVLNEMY